MRIVVFGSTAGVGRLLVTQGLARGHEVTAFARSPHKLGDDRARVRVVEGDAHDAAAVERAVEGQEAVLVALGGRSLVKRDTSCSEGTRHILAAMAQHGVRRIVVCTSLGIGDSRPHIARFVRVLLHMPFLDKEAQEKLIRESATDWTIVRPAGLNDAPARGTIDVAEGGPTETNQIARADVAAFMLDELEQGRYRRRAPSIAWKR